MNGALPGFTMVVLKVPSVSHRCPRSVPRCYQLLIDSLIHLHQPSLLSPWLRLPLHIGHVFLASLQQVIVLSPLPVHVYKRTETRTIYLLLLSSKSKLAFIFKGATMKRSTVGSTVDLGAVERLYWLLLEKFALDATQV